MATPPSKTSLSADRQALLARLLAGKGKLEGAGQGAGSGAIPRRPADAPAPLSFAQQRLWFLWQLEPENPFYNMPLALRLKGRLDVAVLGRTLDEVVRRHESLRTRFALSDGEPVQHIDSVQSLPLEVVEVGNEARAQDLAREEALRPFDLARELPTRVRVLRLADDDHMVLFTLHHIVSDVWSMGVLTQEVVALYAAFLEGKPSPLPELPIQYADFAHWQRAWLQGEVLDRQLAYWKQQLDDAPTLLALPTDRPRPPVQRHRGAIHAFVIDAELAASLRTLAQRGDCTLYMVLLAGFSLLLARYSGQTDICVGSPIANRNRAETERLIGFFVNTLVMRTRLDDDASVMTLLARTREVAMGAYAHQDLPFEQLLDILKPERNLSHAPLFQVSLALQNAPQGRLELPGLTLLAGEGEAHSAKFDLTLFVTETAQGMAAHFEYDTDLFEAATMARMAAHLKRLLQAMCEAPDSRAASLPMLLPAELAQLQSWNATAATFDMRPVHEQFEAWAQRSPQAMAVMFEGAALSYAELDARANGVAHHLVEQGIGAGQRVGVCMERAPEMIVALLAILKAGAAYVPLDPYYPAERLAFMLQDSGVRCVLTQAALTDRLPDVRSIVLEAGSFQQGSGTSPRIGVSLDDIAYVIYTSGSTGRPKGVAVPHRGLCNFRQAEADRFALHEGSRFLQFSSLSFDAMVFEVFVTLTCGATLCLAPQDTLRSVPDLIALMQRDAISITILPPSLLALFPPDTELPALETLITGGDACNPSLAKHWSRGRRFINAYGPTEASVCVAWYECRDLASDTLPIGRPLPNVTLHLLDERLGPVSVGVAGELYVGGIGLAHGYLNQPALTAERFLPDPFSTVPGARLYRSGDKARLLPDGNIEFLGRVDQQVKIRGFRIELGEIENALRESGAVRDCLVSAWSEGDDKRLVAHVVAADTDVTAAALREGLAARLPEYMLPAAIVFLDAFPLTANGKLDRKALPAPDFAAQRTSHVAPRDETERRLAVLWAQVLKQEEVSVHDRFFEVGGHSLLATQLISRIRQSFEVELPLRAIFEAPTIAQLAQQVHSLRQAQAVPPMLPVPRPVAGATMPLSYAQQRLWFLWQLEPENPFYNLPLALRLKGQLAVDVLGRTLDEILRRHESLRTRFAVEDGQPVQRIGPPQSLRLDVVALQSEGQAQALAREEALQPFDLANDLPIRARVLRLAADDHLVLFTLHHIVSDVWSMGVLTQEVVALYSAFLEGKPSPLPALAIQYADFAHWQRNWLQGDVLEAQLDYWTEQLAQAPTLLELPTDRARPAVQRHRGANHAFVIDAQLAGQLHSLARQNDCTLYMVLLAGFSLMLSRYSGQTDLCIGSPIANRNRAETENLIGFFVNTLVMRTRIDGNPTVSDLLGQVREVAMGAYAHQDLPFEQLLERINPERNMSHTPLFQVSLALQNAPQGQLALPGLTLAPAEGQAHSAKYDLSLFVTEAAQGSGLFAHFEYDTDLFEPATLTRMAAHLTNVLRQMCEGPERRVESLSLLSCEAGRALAAQWQADVASHAVTCLHESFEAQAARAPDAVAVLFEGDSLSYAGLNTRANRLAHFLAQQGVGPDVLVGLSVARSIDMVVAILAILKAGGAYLPLDPAYPAERLARMVADAQPRLVLSQAGQGGNELAFGCPVICLDTLDLSAQASSNPASGVSPANLAYVIYTSGSTGMPKGSLISHANVSRLFATTQAQFGFNANDVWTLFHSYAFDFSVWELWGALLHGGRLVVVPQLVSRSPDEFHALLVREGVTVLNQTPSAFRQLMAVDAQAPAHALALRYVIFGGEALVPASLQSWFARHGDARPQLINMYGITETTVHVTCRVLTQEDAGRPGSPIGRPIGDLYAYVLDAGLHPLPAGVPGELYVGGAGLARGYLNRAALTAERFVPDPFATQAGARLYRTGDKARLLDDGSIDYLGRIDQQVKIRGFRIELGEIEAALAQHASVREAAVMAREDIPGDKRLVAYVVPECEGLGDPEALRAHLAERLPDYMLPAAIVQLEVLPINANGKLDYRALPAPHYAAGVTQLAPRNAAEAKLAAIWADVLGVERVGVEDNFFALGGHSLLATQVMSRLEDAFGRKLPLRSLFESPTVAQLAVQLLALPDDAGRTSAAGDIALVPVSREQDLPLSFAQQRMWFLAQLEPDSPFYNIPVALRLRGRLDMAVLGRTLDEILRRHEALRTRFAMRDGDAVQRILPPQELPLPLRELSSLPAEQRESEAAAWLRAEAARAFRLDEELPIRAAVLRLSADDHVLFLNLHHIVSDGWSMSVLTREVAALYAAFSEGRTSPLPELAVQYPDFAYWQRNWLSGGELARQLAYWKDQLGDAPALLELPTDRPRPPVQSHKGDYYAFGIDAELAGALRGLAQQGSATLYMVLLAGFSVLLGRYSGQDDVCIGSPIANRGRPELESLIGFFVNTLVMRMRLGDEPSVEELLTRTRQVAMDAYAHQDVPFEYLLEVLNPERKLSHSQLFQASLTLQNAPAARLELPGLELQPLASDTYSAKFDLTLFVNETPDGLAANFEYSTDLFDRSTIARMARHLVQLLRAMCAAPGMRLGQLALLSPDERAQQIAGWNDTAAAYPPEMTVHGRIARQACTTPEAVAARCGDEVLSYRELERRARQFAMALRARGVRPGTRVAVCLDRSLDMLVGVLAVLKAGGAYVPLDPAYPRERLAYMMEDAEPAVLLTQAALRTALGLQAADVLSMDEDWPAVAALQGDLLELAGRDDLAYVIYTSGSTGRPKGVEISHGAVINFLESMAGLPGMAVGDRLLAVTPLSFDIAGLELYLPLSVGAEVVIAERDTAADGSALDAAVIRHGITVVQATPATWRLWLESGRTQGLQGLRVLCGGEALPVPLADALRAAGAHVFNMYGPTETTIWSTCQPVTEDATLASVSIGRPIANTCCYVLDARLEPVPIGVVGELYIAGDGLARGYFRRPELSAEKFLPNPHAARAGERMYRTGDKARYLADGRLEFLGRADFQVKIRGFRIELGEIESALSRHAAVKEAAVTAYEDQPGDQRLVAYVVPRGPEEEAPSNRALQDEQVAQWQAIYDESYAQTNDESDPLQNFGIWSSSYTGRPIPREEMREWADNTVARIRALKPRRILEIGCGTGLLLFRLAPHCEAYCGTDFSPQALDYVRRHLGAAHRHVSLREQAAHDFAGFMPGDYDLVVINSVAQYFPDGAYLQSVIHGALEVVAPAGRVFLGDLRNLRLHEAFQAGIELHRAAAELPARQIMQAVRKQLAIENELLIDPEFFASLSRREPRVRRADVVLKREAYDNELSRHRYDVVLHCGAVAAARPTTWLDWSEQVLTLDGVRRLLTDKPPVLCLANVPNARSLREARAAELLRAPEGQTAASLRAALGEAGGVEPAQLQAIATELGYGFQASWLRTDARGAFLALFIARGAGFQPDVSVLPLADMDMWTNQPLRNQLGARLPGELGRHLRGTLPEYMLPSHYVFLDAMPLTPNGKLDRKALPHPEAGERAQQGDVIAPRDETETLLGAIWCEVLKLDAVGMHDNFFELGGHSLLATRVVSRIREQTGIDLPLRRFFEAPTIESLANALREASAGEAPPPLVAVARDSDLPLSFAQQRLWSLAQIEPENPFYNLPLVIRHAGVLDPIVLRDSLQAMVARHEPLRTLFPLVEDAPVQQILAHAECPFSLIDVSGEPGDARDALAAQRVRQEVRKPFLLDRELPVRACVLRLAEDNHVIVVTLHHIICDGWSSALIGREFSAIHQALSQGRQPALAPLALQYADFAHWQRGWLRGPVLDRQLAYWKTQLVGAPDMLQLPTDTRRAAHAAYRAGRESVLLDRQSVTALELAARQHHATLFMALFAGLQVALARWSGQTDFVLGTVIAGRNQLGTEDMLGCFMNFLPLRARVAPDATLASLLQAAAESIPDAYAHQDCPFELIVDTLKPERRAGQNPLFNVALLLQNFAEQGVRAPEPADHGLGDVSTGAGVLDLRFVAQMVGDAMQIECEYRAGLFAPTTIRALLDFVQHCLALIAGSPTIAISDLPLPAELTAQVAAARERERPQTLAIAASFTAEPLQDGLEFWLRTLERRADIVFAPYNQVFQSLLDPGSAFARNSFGANLLLVRLEDWLRFAEVGQGDPGPRFADIVKRSTGELIDALRAFDSRAKVMTLLCLCPASSNVLADQASQILIVEAGERLREACAGLASVRMLDCADLAGQYDVLAYEDAAADAAGHVPYTESFFVALASRLMRAVESLRRPPYKVLVLDCDNTLWRGVCAEDGAQGVALEPPYEALQRFAVAQHDAGMIVCLASKNAPEDVWAVFDSRADFPLRREHLADAELHWESKSTSLRRLSQRLGLGLDSFVFFDDNPVECAEVMAACPEVLTVQLPQEASAIPRTLAHLWAFDRFGAVTAEAKMRTRQYRENAQREALRGAANTFADFLTHLALEVEVAPLQPAALERVAELTQRTNQFNLSMRRRNVADIRRACEEGMEALCVSVRDRFGDYGLTGVLFHRVEGDVCEVDTFLLSCRVLGRGVEHAVLRQMAASLKPRGIRQIALPFVESARNRPIHDFLRGIDAAQTGAGVFRFPLGQLLDLSPAAPINEDVSLAADMVDIADVDGAEGPLVDHPSLALMRRVAHSLNSADAVLEAMGSQRRQRAPGGEVVAARDPIEQKLVTAWQRVLRLDRISIHDNFFELGGDSLRSIQLVAHIRAAGLQVTPQQVMAHPSVAELARVVTRAEADTDSGARGRVPLTPRQRWFLDMDVPNPNYHNTYLVAPVPADFDAAFMTQAFAFLCAHHDAIRLRFERGPEGWQQHIAEAQTEGFQAHDLSQLSQAQQRAEMHRIGCACHEGLDLIEGPLLRLAFFRLGADRPGRLLAVAHHIIVDGFALQLIVQDLTRLYGQLQRGRHMHLPPRTASFKEWAEAAQARARSADTLAELPYWLAQADEPFHALPRDHETGPHDEASARLLSMRLSAAETEALNKLLRSRGLPLNTALAAALSQVLGAWAGHDAVWLELAHHGRDAAHGELDVSRTVGWVTANYPVALRREVNDSPRQTLERVAAQLAEVPGQGTSYGLLRYMRGDLALAQQLETLPQPEVFLNFLGHAAERSDTEAAQQEDFGAHRNPCHARSWLIYCRATVQGEALVVEWEYSANRHRHETMAALAQACRAFLLDLAGMEETAGGRKLSLEKE